MSTTDASATDGAGEELRGLAAGYALGALDSDEHSRFEAALAESPELRAEVAAFDEVRIGLAPAEEPPPGLRDAVLALTAEAPQAPPAARMPRAQPAAHRPAPVARLDTRHPWYRRPAALVAAAAAVVLLVGGAVLGIGWPGENGWGAQRELAAIEQAPDRRSAEIELADGGTVTLVWSAEQARSAVLAEDLAELDPDRTYELWYIDAEGATPAGTFDGGSGESWRLLDGAMTPGVAVGITVEPAGGSPRPTSEPIAVFET